MKKYKHIIEIGAVLISLSAVLYFINFMIFGDLHHMILVMSEELAFMPIYVFITAVIAERLLARKEKQELARKMNALVGLFFSEMGNDMIKKLVRFDLKFDRIQKEFAAIAEWDEEKSKYIRGILLEHESGIKDGNNELSDIKAFMMSKKDFMLDLLSNISLIEKDEFSDLLLSANHIIEEFKLRGDLSTYSKADIAHLHIDLERAYKHLISEWINYMLYLKKEYPYLYNLAVRANPFITA
ncbi:MAG: hypothetical protein AB9844_11860 [Clostridiaceae bacterium]